jgi:cell cycle checkpoint control protein RAD9A
VIGPKAMRDMIDHFPSTRGKADPQLTWVFDDTEVHIRSLENSLNSNGTRNNVSSISIYLKIRSGGPAGHRIDYQRGRI